jgi:DNA-binding MarR family transcriptional regulator
MKKPNERRGKANLPIGYWLKQADAVLTEHINQAQQNNGLSRTDWQVLNLLSERGTASWEDIAEPLRPFADGKQLEAVVHHLVARRLIEGAGELEFRLTDQGSQVHREALSAQKKVRQKAIDGVSQTEFETTLRVLQRIVANLSEGV